MAAISKTVSKAGYAKLQEELEYLITVKRREVAQKLKEARSFGDLSENAEYDEAKNEQAILESKINELELLILLKIHAPNMKYYQEFILNVLGTIDSLGSLESTFVMAEVKHQYGIHI